MWSLTHSFGGPLPCWGGGTLLGTAWSHGTLISTHNGVADLQQSRLPISSGPLRLLPFSNWHLIKGLPPSPAGMGEQISLRCVASGLQDSWGCRWPRSPGPISVCLCFPPLPTIIFKYFSSTGRHIHTHTPHSLSVSHTHTKTHLTRRLLIYVPEHFQIFAFQVLNVCSSYRCFQIILILIAKAARRDRIF